MLEPIQRPCEHRALLVPDYLLVVDEADVQESRKHLAGELGGVPDVSDLQIRQKRECFRPICPRITGRGGPRGGTDPHRQGQHTGIKTPLVSAVELQFSMPSARTT
jgi:hypothetical protein